MYSVNTVYKGNCHSCFTNKEAEIIGKQIHERRLKKKEKKIMFSLTVSSHMLTPTFTDKTTPCPSLYP